jgi:AraC family transcriptional regulator
MPVMKGWLCMIVDERPVPALETSMSENEAVNTNLPTVDGFPPPVTPGKDRSWRNISATRLTRDIDEVAVPALPDHAVLMNVGQPYRLEEELDGRAHRTFGVKGDVAIVPAGVPTEFRSREREPQKVESLVMYLDRTFVRGIAEGVGVDPARVELVGTLGARDPEIERIGASLLSELESGTPCPSQQRKIKATV